MNEKQTRTTRRIGDRVRITRTDSVKHRLAGDLPLTGEIVKIALDHGPFGSHYRPFLIRFNNDPLFDSWWATDEIRKIKR